MLNLGQCSAPALSAVLTAPDLLGSPPLAACPPLLSAAGPANVTDNITTPRKHIELVVRLQEAGRCHKQGPAGGNETGYMGKASEHCIRFQLTSQAELQQH
jgi:hypothetical protein